METPYLLSLLPRRAAVVVASEPVTTDDLLSNLAATGSQRSKAADDDCEAFLPSPCRRLTRSPSKLAGCGAPWIGR